MRYTARITRNESLSRNGCIREIEYGFPPGCKITRAWINGGAASLDAFIIDEKRGTLTTGYGCHDPNGPVPKVEVWIEDAK